MPRDSESRKSDRQLMEEMSARARRIETRTTLIANHLGVELNTEKPEYDPASRQLHIRSPKTPIGDVLAAIEDDVAMVQVFCNGQFLGSVCPAA